MLEVSAADARRIALWRQGLLGPAPRPGRANGQEARVRAMLDDLGAVQLDTISVLARSHELIAYARLGAVRREAIEAAYWSGDTAFEYWSHAACILPMELWPLFSFRRRHYRSRRSHWHEVDDAAVKRVVRRLRTDGPITTRELGGAKSSSEWWDWSDAKIAVEWLLSIGTVVCTQRTGWRRVYDLAERAIPEHLQRAPGWRTIGGVHGPSDAECLRELVARSVDVMGIGTLDDIADVHRLPKAGVRAALRELEVPQAQVEGWTDAAYLSGTALDRLSTRSRAGSRTTLLSPFDSLVWHRPRTERLFGMTHRLEAYTPSHRRVHGYFAMPVLHRGRLVGRVDPKREGRTLVAQRVTLEEQGGDAVEGIAAALVEAAGWVGCDHIRIKQAVPRAERVRLQRAVSTAH